MAIRTVVDDVKEIFQVNTLTDDQITRFIQTANLVVENNLDTGDFDYTADELTEIELYLSAHFCALRDPRPTMERVDDLQANYQGKTGMRLESTHYGQTAIMLDRYGVLQRIGKKRVASLITVSQFATTDSRYKDYS